MCEARRYFQRVWEAWKSRHHGFPRFPHSVISMACFLPATWTHELRHLIQCATNACGRRIITKANFITVGRISRELISCEGDQVSAVNPARSSSPGGFHP
jgi:hypothetical protein